MAGLSLTPAPPRNLSLVTLLSLSNVGIEFGATTLLDGVTFTVAKGERWGIVGRNGCGKTSVFKVITGALTPTSGAVARMPGLRVSLLDQHRDFGDATTVWAAAARTYAEVMQLEITLAETALTLAELGEKAPEALLEQYGHDMERFANEGGYTFHARVDAVLQGLGFDADKAKSQLVKTLSGGERGRLGLAAQLVSPADLLLLDEPTNHLDLKTKDILKSALQDYDGTMILVSHDRDFLDGLVNKVFEFGNRRVKEHLGDIHSFLQKKKLENLKELERKS